MQYNGKELKEMLPKYWDGRSREMLVWNTLDTKVIKEKIIGYNVVSDEFDKFYWMDKYGNLWKRCAEIPEESNQAQNIDEMIKILNAYKEGKIIEHRFRNREMCDSWSCINLQNPDWNWAIFEYRVKQEPRRMTYRELDEWLKQGKGVCKMFFYLTNNISYWPENEDKEVKEGILICPFGKLNFEEPLIKE